LIKFTEKTVDAIKWLRDNIAALKEALPEIKRIAGKVDGFRVTGHATFSNQKTTMSLFIPAQSPPVNNSPKIETVFIHDVINVGFYRAKTIRGPAPDPTADIEASDFGDAGSVIEVIVVNAAEIKGGAPYLDGDVLQVLLFGSVTYENVLYPYGIPLTGKASSFDVTLTQTGGADGTVSTAPTYTYTATDFNGNDVAFNLSPEHNRPMGKTMAATLGRVLFNGSFSLISSDERPDFEEC
jgi:hypothetical protein